MEPHLWQKQFSFSANTLNLSKMWEELARMKEVDRPGAALKAACHATLAAVQENVPGENRSSDIVRLALVHYSVLSNSAYARLVGN